MVDYPLCKLCGERHRGVDHVWKDGSAKGKALETAVSQPVVAASLMAAPAKADAPRERKRRSPRRAAGDAPAVPSLPPPAADEGSVVTKAIEVKPVPGAVSYSEVDAALDAPAEKRRPGRPAAPKPWEAEGVSRQTWYRRGNRKAEA
ncbi:MAG: hypothetical protein JO234_04225 [Hyphomicrobiales bacterium]|nr:hypothetical protein [Hyphomicrobiales bacterium]